MAIKLTIEDELILKVISKDQLKVITPDPIFFDYEFFTTVKEASKNKPWPDLVRRTRFSVPVIIEIIQRSKFLQEHAYSKTLEDFLKKHADGDWDLLRKAIYAIIYGTYERPPICSRTRYPDFISIQMSSTRYFVDADLALWVYCYVNVAMENPREFEQGFLAKTFWSTMRTIKGKLATLLYQYHVNLINWSNQGNRIIQCNNEYYILDQDFQRLR